jgi:hypothetical protein
MTVALIVLIPAHVAFFYWWHARSLAGKESPIGDRTLVTFMCVAIPVTFAAVLLHARRIHGSLRAVFPDLLTFAVTALGTSACLIAVLTAEQALSRLLARLAP